MDPMALLDMERRTGIATKDVDDFVNRMDLISKAMEQIKDGTFDPEACQIPGYKSPAQEAREAEERARKEQERRRKAEEKKHQEKTEEKEQWWKRAKLRFALERGEDDEHDDNDAEMGKHDVKAEATQWANRVLAAYKARDANDYSVWNNWVPEDPATLEEKAAREAALEKMRNDEFEKNNPEFCQQFRNDLEKRQQTQRERERGAEKLKLVGNRHYKRREYEQAIAQYMKALEKAPFNVAVLTNIAQSYLRLEELDDSVEFSTRALYVNPDHVKALSRRAAVWHRQHKWEQAAHDMEKALQLDPENEDVVEQHSIVVGDYEDSITQSQLDAMLTSKTTGDVETAAELRLISELLSKIDEQEKTTLENNETGCMVLEAWMGYQLLVPCLERNSDARDFMRTSGELAKLTQRLLRIIIPSSFEQHLVKWTEIEYQQDAAMVTPRVEELTLTAMIHVLAVCLTNSPRNQVVQYRDTAFRHTIVGLLASSEGVKLTSLPAGIQEQLLRVVEEVIDSKAWKKEVIASTSAIRGLLDCVATPLGSSISSSDVGALTKAAVSASSILFTISGDDPHGLKALTAEPSCLKAIADGLQSQRRSTATLSNMLGVLTNLSTIVAVRSVLDAPNVDCADDISMLRSRLVRSLLVLSTHFTKSSLSPQKRSLYQVCAERALAALLNFTFQSNSPVRIELIRHDVLAAVLAILEYVTASDIDELMVIISRTVSLLCRLHSLEPDTLTTAQQSLKIDLTSRTLLDKLYQLCELSVPSFAATATSAASPDLWQTHAQIWCHVGWCISIAGCEKATRAYLEEKQALPSMIETLDRVNTQRMYHRGASEAPTSAERIAGNIVKVLIAMLPQTNVTAGAAFWSRTQNLQVLVDALQNVPDGLARKNVAILLAKLCQIFGDAVKDKVRALRGIEMMLTVSKSLSTPRQPSTTSKPKAVAF